MDITTAGIRPTATRRELVELLTDAARPITIPEILTLRPHLAQSSVYRNLSLLERAGIVRSISPVNPLGHAHFALVPTDGTVPVYRVCTTCSRVDELATVAGMHIALGDGAAADVTGTTALIAIAVCPGCTNDEASS